jgi:hypothetical protein
LAFELNFACGSISTLQEDNNNWDSEKNMQAIVTTTGGPASLALALCPAGKFVHFIVRLCVVFPDSYQASAIDY